MWSVEIDWYTSRMYRLATFRVAPNHCITKVTRRRDILTEANTTAAGGESKNAVCYTNHHIIKHMSVWSLLNVYIIVCRKLINDCNYFLNEILNCFFTFGILSQQSRAKALVTAALLSVGCTLDTSWPCDFLSAAFWLEAQKRQGWREEGGACGWRGAGWQKTHERKQIPAPLPWRWANSMLGGRGEGAQADLL